MASSSDFGVVVKARRNGTVGFAPPPSNNDEENGEQETGTISHPTMNAYHPPVAKENSAENAADSFGPSSTTLPSMSSVKPETVNCEVPKGYVSNDTMLGFWRFVYWMSQLLTW
jgi:hypothetical protein